MVLWRTRLRKPGFALLAALLLPLSVFAGNLKPVRTFKVSLPKIYQTADSGPYGLQYIRPGELAFWVTDRTQGALSRRDKLLDTDPWHLKVHLFDQEGKALKSVEWPTHRESTSLQAEADGTVTVLTGPVLRCLDSDLAPIALTDLSSRMSHRDLRVLSPSPGGDTAWVISLGDRLDLTRVNTRTCQTQDALNTVAKISTITANDHVIVASNRSQFGYHTSSGFRLFYQSGCCISGVAFVSQNVLMAFRKTPPDNHSLLAFNLEGKLLLHQSLQRNYGGDMIIPSSNGHLVAVVEGYLGQFPGLPDVIPSDYLVRIYSLPSLKLVATFDFPSENYNLFALAISPDDRHVAVFTHSKIAIYDVRPQAKGKRKSH